jgi:negative regulator of sigma E activity
MSELLREQMSAFADDALPAEEGDLLLRRVREDGALREAWACYHLIGASLRREPDASGLAERVRSALDGEPALSGRPSLGWQRVLKPAMGVGIAAAVAMLALAGLQSMHQQRGVGQVEQVAQVEPESYTVAPRSRAASTPARQDVTGRAQLVQYALRHSNYATMPNAVIMNYRTVVGGGQHAGTEAGATRPAIDEPDADQQ